MTCLKGASPSALNKAALVPAADLILASASARRLALLEQIGVTPAQVVPADIDESLNGDETPRLYAQRMAKTKAERVFAQHPDQLVLAADTVVAVGQRVLPKAECEQSASYCLSMLSGRSHRVYGAIALLSAQGLRTRLVETRLKFKRLDHSEIKAYLESEQWRGKAGGYAIQDFAGAFVLSLQGSYTNVVGLSLYETYCLLKGSGYSIKPLRL